MVKKIGNFDIKREKEIIDAGSHFWCRGHSGAVLVGEQSPDPRYCRFCFTLLTDEVYILKEKHQFNNSMSWAPKTPAKGAEPVLGQATAAASVSGKVEHSKRDTGILIHKRGRPKIEIPIDQVNELRRQGKGMKEIAKQLGLSPMTVSRSLVGAKP
jgi:hypothetical protein